MYRYLSVTDVVYQENQLWIEVARSLALILDILGITNNSASWERKVLDGRKGTICYLR